jgi:YggT family protein
VVGLLFDLARWLVFAAFAFFGVVAITNWAVRTRRLNPFGAYARFIRQLSEPSLQWMERRLLRAGGNPQHAPYWLFGLVLAAGLVLLSLLSWLLVFIMRVTWAVQSPGSLVYLLVDVAFQLLMLALLVRVVASWFGVSPYARWMRPVILLTEWILAPLRRIVPQLGMLDITPLVAYLILLVLDRLALSLIAR